ncbi:uncharacterized protein [Elaeis guineensis]|uniref:uncharacterized protein isoform X2 n=1 Tax=Elaeis guineensis var. tenera TaxID=51953 RepID=UPI003C6D0E88
MEFASLPRIPLLASSQCLNPSLNCHHPSLPLQQYPSSSSSSSLRARCFGSLDPRRSLDLFSISFAGNILWSSPTAPVSRRLASISRSVAIPDSGGGGDGEGGSKEVPALGPDVIVLQVGGMSCGGCVASVKRILESQPQVSSATVSLETETAFVWTVPEVKVTQDWQHQLGEKLANHLTSCGFKSGFRDGFW